MLGCSFALNLKRLPVSFLLKSSTLNSLLSDKLISEITYSQYSAAGVFLFLAYDVLLSGRDPLNSVQFTLFQLFPHLSHGSSVVMEENRQWSDQAMMTLQQKPTYRAMRITVQPTPKEHRVINEKEIMAYSHNMEFMQLSSSF